ncbi:unnamed protein product [Rhodiola kirilowii]
MEDGEQNRRGRKVKPEQTIHCVRLEDHQVIMAWLFPNRL